MIFQLIRLSSGKFSTRSEILGPDGRRLSFAVERGPANPDHPRIPPGLYPLSLRKIPSHFDSTYANLFGSAYKGMIQVDKVPWRTAIEIHTANSWTQLLGCIAPGTAVQHGPDGEWLVPGGLSTPAFRTVYMAMSLACLAGPSSLAVSDSDGAP